MEVNDTGPETDQNFSLQEPDQVQEIYLENDDDDVHVCRKCNIIFYDVHKYLEHKVKHDNYKVRYCRSNVDKRMVVPKLVQKPIKKEPGDESDNKENKKGKPGRKKKSVLQNQEQVFTERAGYSCSKCGRKFNREASLKRHMEYDHQEADSEEERDEDEVHDSDSDQDYKPTRETIKEELAEEAEAEQEMPADHLEIDSLDQVIMAAAFVEAGAQAGQDHVTQVQVNAADGTSFVINTDGKSITNLDGNLLSATSSPLVKNLHAVDKSPKVQKLSEEDKAQRKYTCSVCDNKFKELTVLKAHLLTHSAKRPYQCRAENCPYAFKTKGSLKRHMRRHTGERPYGCELCGRSFAESGALTRHLKSRSSCKAKSDDDFPRYGKKWSFTPNIPAVQAARMSQQNQVQADKADPKIGEDVQMLTVQTGEPGTVEETMGTETHILGAISNTSEKELFDIETGESVEVVISEDTETEITADDSIRQFVHSETVIQDTTSTVCKVCENKFSSSESLRIHLHTHLADNTCRCLLCHFVTDNREDFETHMFHHHHVQLKNGDPFSALSTALGADQHDPQPDKAASQRHAQIAVRQMMELSQEEEVTVPLDVGVGLPLYKCPVCQKQFRDSSYLKLHMRNHTGLKPHKCSECDKSFITKDTLNKHIASHVEDRNFKCGKCGKLFKRLGHVREHIRIHSQTRPFQCTVCDKSFKTNNAMKVHLRTHTDILPYECTFCHRRFREKGSVVRHMRMHTGEKPYECRHCGKRFAEHGTLNRHLKAKVSCKRSENQVLDDLGEESTDYTVLAEFSSVVADTQQYIVAEEGDHDHLAKSQHITYQLDGTEQEAQYVVVHTNDGDEADIPMDNMEIQNIEVVTNADTKSSVEGLQISDDYIVVNDAEAGCIRILDNKTGEVVAIVPSEASDDQVQTITMESQDGEVSMVTLLSEGQDGGNVEEMVTMLTESGAHSVVEATECGDGEVDDGIEQAAEEGELVEGHEQTVQVIQDIEHAHMGHGELHIVAQVDDDEQVEGDMDHDGLQETQEGQIQGAEEIEIQAVVQAHILNLAQGHIEIQGDRHGGSQRVLVGATSESQGVEHSSEIKRVGTSELQVVEQVDSMQQAEHLQIHSYSEEQKLQDNVS